MTDRRFEELRFAAFLAVQAANGLADEVDDIIDKSLPANASRALRADLRRVAMRQRGIAAALAQELDDPSPDREVVGLLTSALRRAASIFAAGIMFTAGAGATGAFEDLGADLKDSLLERVAAVERASEEVDSTIKTGIPRPTPSPIPQEPSQLLEAADTRDTDRMNRELVFLLELETLLREVLTEGARDAYGDEWSQVLDQSLAGTQPSRERSQFSRPSQWSFDELVRIASIMDDDGYLPPVLRTPLPGGTMPLQLLPRLIALRNEYAHGLTIQPDWLDKFLMGGGREVLADAGRLYARIRDAR